MAAAHVPGVCARFHEAVELIGARWTGAILQVLLRGPARYADVRAAVPDISDRMLCERLRALEQAGIVARQVSTAAPVRVDYELTDKGLALEPALAAIGRGAETWIEPPAPARPERARRAPTARARR
jgi:DNA-binding HxlR family transcriptional regulator